jgi:hypothetical protein
MAVVVTVVVIFDNDSCQDDDDRLCEQNTALGCFAHKECG